MSSKKSKPITYVLDGKTEYKTITSENHEVISVTGWMDDNKTLSQVTTNKGKSDRSYTSKRYLSENGKYMIIELTNHKGTVMKRNFKKVVET